MYVALFHLQRVRLGEGFTFQGTTLSIIRTIIFVGIFKALWRDPPCHSCQGPRKDMPASLKECWGPWSHIVEEFLKHTSWLLCCDNHLDHNEVDHQTCLKITNIHWMFHKHKQQREQYSCLKQHMARPQLVKRYGGSSPKMAISQSVRSCEIGSTLGILTVFLKTGFIFLGQQAKNSFQSCSNLLKTKKNMFFSHVYTLYKTGIHHHGGETWHLSYRSSSFSRVMFPGARRIYDEGT